MATINSVTGPLDTGDLGFTLSHEHVLLTSAGIQSTFPEFIDREGTIRKAVEQLKSAHRDGLRTIVDVTTMDLGRDVKLLQQVSRESGVQIICSTGIWFDIPRVFWHVSPDAIAPLFVREIREGIEQTGIRPGIIKVATHVGGVTPEGEIILRAAARAHKETGVPITTHTYALERVGDQQIRVFEDEGVDLSRVYIGHNDDSDDMGYLTGMLEKGVWLGLDHLTFGHRPGLLTLDKRLDNATSLIDAGYADRIMLGHDWTANMLIFDEALQRSREEYNPHGYSFVARTVIPKLLERGVSEETARRLTVDNPRRFFEVAA